MRHFIYTVIIGFLGCAIGFGAAFTYTRTIYTNNVGSVVSSDVLQAPEYPVLLAVGDIMLGRNVENLMSKNGDEYPFKNIQDLLVNPDIVIANLEGPILNNHVHTPSGSVRFAFDVRMPHVLALHNIGIVSLANNHTFDFGSDGYNQTVHYAESAGIDVIGHPFSTHAQYILRKQIKNMHFIFVGFNFTNPNFNKQDAYDLVTTLNPSADEFLIAVIHGGDEYKLTSNKNQQEFYRGLIDHGVKAVIAHHPHVVEEIEVYKNRAIFYSLGNFIFDQYFSKDVQDELAVEMNFTKDSITYRLIPVVSMKSQPQLMTEEQKNIWLANLAARSAHADKEDIKKGTFTLPL